MPEPLVLTPPASPEVEHAPTADVVTTMTALLEHGGWARSGDLARVSGVHRDTARRILRQLASAGWVEARELEGETRYRIGPELPRLGLAFLGLLQREQDDARTRFQAATVPHTWAPGAGGRMAWRPAPRTAKGGGVPRKLAIVDQRHRIRVHYRTWELCGVVPGQSVEYTILSAGPLDIQVWDLDGVEIQKVSTVDGAP